MSIDDRLRGIVNKYTTRKGSDNKPIYAKIWEEDVDNFITEIKKVIAEELPIPENPYPESIFPEPTNKEWDMLNEILRNAGIKPDKFNGSWARKVWDTCCRDYRTELLSKLGVKE